MDSGSTANSRLLSWLTPLRFAIFIALLLVVAFPKVLLGFDTLFYRDYGVWGYPFAFYQHESFWRGELPLWNGLSNCGAPLLAQWGTMTLYPFSLFYLIFPLPWSLTYFCFAHLVLGSLGMYYLCFRLTESRAAAALAGTAYLFNGLSFSCLIWPSYMVALGWMPWVVLTTQRAWEEGRRQIVVAAVVAALQLLAGAPEIAMLTWVLVGALWVHSMFIRKALPSLTFRLGAVIAIAAGLAAVQLLPFFDLLMHSHRDGTFADSRWAMPSWGWGNFLVPLFHCYQSPTGPSFQYGQEFFSSYYLGAAILTLAIGATWRTHDLRIRLLAALAVIASLLALGENGFLYPIAKKCFPLISIARFPVKFLIVPAFVAPLLAGVALSRLEISAGGTRQHSRALTFAFSIVASLIVVTLLIAKFHPFLYDQWAATLKNALGRLLFLALFGTGIFILARGTAKAKANIIVSVLLLTIFADTLSHTTRQNPSLPWQALAGGLWQAQATATAPKYGESRVFINPQAEQHLLRNTVRDPAEGLLGQRLALWSNLHLLDSIPKVNGSSTLQILHQKQLENLIYKQTNALPTGLLDFLGVSYTSGSNLTEWAPRTNFCAFITGGQKPEYADDATIFRKLLGNDFDPRQTVFLPAELQTSIGISNSTLVEISQPSITMHRLTFKATAKEPALCVVAQTFYHCWKPFIDGKPAQLLRANGAFQAIVVPAGQHEIAFSYRDYSFYGGAAISISAIIACVVLWQRKKPVFLQSADISETEDSREQRVAA